MKPKFKDNVFFAPVEEGLFFRGSSGSLVLKGARLYEWFERLLPYLQGNVELEQILRSLSPERREVVASLVRRLVDRGFIKDVSRDEPHGLSEAELTLYADSLRFIDDLQDSAGRRFETFRRARVLVVGRGRALLGASRGLFQAGLRGLVTLTDDAEAEARVGEEAGGHASKDPLFRWEGRRLEAGGTPDWERELGACEVVVALGSEEWLGPLSVACKRAGRRLVVGAQVGGSGWVGQVVVPGQAGCWACARARLEACPQEAPPHWPAMGELLLGQLAAFEVFKVLTGAMPPTEPGSVMQVEPHRLNVDPRALPLWPGCGVCAPQAAGLEEVLALWRRRTQPRTRKEAWALAEPFIEPLTGVLAQVTPGELMQLPLCQSSATLRLPGRPTQVAAGLDHEQARHNALCLGLETYARQVAESLGDTRGALVWGGPVLPEREAREHPFASGETWDEWVGQGLRAGVEQQALRQLEEGTLLLARLLPGEGGEPQHTLLLKTLSVREGIPIEIHRVTDSTPYTVLVFTQGSRLLGVAAERTVHAALEKGLLALVHGLQQLPEGTSRAGWLEQRPLARWQPAPQERLEGAPAPVPSWAEWTPLVLEWLRSRGRRLVMRAFTTDPVVARAGLLCGWVWHEEAGS